jgi:hypothetical protein
MHHKAGINYMISKKMCANSAARSNLSVYKNEFLILVTRALHNSASERSSTVIARSRIIQLSSRAGPVAKPQSRNVVFWQIVLI